MSALAIQVAAATRAANLEIANGGTDFYAEIGTKSSGSSPLWSGSFGGGTVVATTAAGVFSVSKAVFALYAAQRQALTATDKPYFEMTSGRDTANGATCNQDNIQTIDACITAYMGVGNAAHNGLFNYDSLHQEWWSDKIAASSMGALTRSQITALYLSAFGMVTGDISMSSSTLSGGVIAKPTTLRNLAQQLMNGTLNLKGYLTDPQWTPVNASNYFTDGSVVKSPAPSDQPWLYLWNHWVEPGGGYFWWAGSGGTVLWMDKTFNNYGLLFRNADTSGGEMGTQSIFAMQRIRRAFLQAGPRYLHPIELGPIGVPWAH